MFTKKKIKFLGRVGLLYTDEGGKQYFLNTEFVASQEFDLIIYDKKILLVEGNKKKLVNEMNATIILEKILNELHRMGLRYMWVEEN